jgi:transcription factor TFIIIB component B''
LVPTSDPSATVPTPENSTKKKLRKRKKKDVAEGDEDATEGETSGKPKAAKKKRAKKEAAENSDDVQPKPRKKRKARAETTDEESTPVKKKRKKSTQPIFDPDADPGEEIDPTVVTMAELCSDNGQGRISSKAIEIQKNHLAWKQQSKEKRARMKALAEQKKYGRPEEEDGEDEAVPAVVTEAAPVPDDSGEVIVGSSDPSVVEPAIADASGSGFDYSQDLTRSRFTVQVRIGPNGETIIDEESLTVDREDEPDTSNYTHVVESDHTKFVNSASYTKKCRGSRWSAEETDLFFEASPSPVEHTVY